MRGRLALLALTLLPLASVPATAYMAYVTNERDNTLSAIDLSQMKTVKTVPVGQRPRGITMTKDGSEILICASDDDTIQIVDPKTLRVVGDLPSGPDPETFALHGSGNPLYVSNEDDNLVTVIDVAKRKMLDQIPTGVEPEGMAGPEGLTKQAPGRARRIAVGDTRAIDDHPPAAVDLAGREARAQQAVGQERQAP